MEEPSSSSPFAAMLAQEEREEEAKRQSQQQQQQGVFPSSSRIGAKGEADRRRQLLGLGAMSPPSKKGNSTASPYASAVICPSSGIASALGTGGSTLLGNASAATILKEAMRLPTTTIGGGGANVRKLRPLGGSSPTPVLNRSAIGLLPPVTSPLPATAAGPSASQLTVDGTHLTMMMMGGGASSTSVLVPDRDATQGTAQNRSAFPTFQSTVQRKAAQKKGRHSEENGHEDDNADGGDEENEASSASVAPIKPIGDVSHILRSIAGTMTLISSEADRKRLQSLKDAVAASAAQRGDDSEDEAERSSTAVSFFPDSVAAAAPTTAASAAAMPLPLRHIALLPPSQLFSDWCAEHAPLMAARKKQKKKAASNVGNIPTFANDEAAPQQQTNATVVGFKAPQQLAIRSELETALSSRNAAVALHKEVQKQLSILFAAAAASEDNSNNKTANGGGNSSSTNTTNKNGSNFTTPQSPRQAAIAAIQKLSNADRARRIRRVYDDAAYEIVRQVSLHCAERARLLAFVWVSSSDALANLSERFDAQNEQHSKEIKALQLTIARANNSYETLSKFVCDSASEEGAARMAIMEKYFALQKEMQVADTNHKNELLMSKAAMAQLLDENKKLKEKLRRRRDFLRADGGFVFLRAPDGSKIVRRRRRELKYKGLYYDDPDVTARRELIESLPKLEFERLQLPFEWWSTTKSGRRKLNPAYGNQEQQQGGGGGKGRGNPSPQLRADSLLFPAITVGTDESMDAPPTAKRGPHGSEGGGGGAEVRFADALHIDSAGTADEDAPIQLRRRRETDPHEEADGGEAGGAPSILVASKDAKGGAASTSLGAILASAFGPIGSGVPTNPSTTNNDLLEATTKTNLSDEPVHRRGAPDESETSDDKKKDTQQQRGSVTSVNSAPFAQTTADDGDDSDEWSGDLRSEASDDNESYYNQLNRYGGTRKVGGSHRRRSTAAVSFDRDDEIAFFEELDVADEAEEIIQTQLQEIFKLRLQLVDLSREIDKLRDGEKEVVFRHTGVNTNFVETRDIGVMAAPGMGIGARRKR